MVIKTEYVYAFNRLHIIFENLRECEKVLRPYENNIRVQFMVDYMNDAFPVNNTCLTVFIVESTPIYSSLSAIWFDKDDGILNIGKLK